MASFRVGLMITKAEPPYSYACNVAYLRKFYSCYSEWFGTPNVTSCTLVSVPSCLAPGPGAYIELFAFLLIALGQNFTVHEFHVSSMGEKIALLENGTVDIIPDPVALTDERWRRIRYTTAPFPPGRYTFILRSVVYVYGTQVTVR